MHCNYCGAENKEGASFCRRCGKPLQRRDSGGRKLSLIALLAVALVAVATVTVVAISTCRKNGIHGSTQDTKGVLARLAELNGDELLDIYFDPDDGTPRFITGRYTDRVIRSAEDAVDSIGDVAALYGFADPRDEFTVAKVTELDDRTIYRLQQYYSGVEVFGNQLVVSCDAEGRAESLSGCYLGGIDIDLPDTGQMADGMGLAVWDGDVGPQAVLKFEDATGVTLYSAETGEVVYSQSFIETVAKEFDDIEVDGEELSFTVERVEHDGGTGYALRDVTRNLVVFDAGGRELTYDRYLRDGVVQCGTCGISQLKWYGDTIKKGTLLDDGDITASADGTHTATKGGKVVTGLVSESLADEGNEALVWLDDDVEGVSDATEQLEFAWYLGGESASGIKALSYVTKTYDFYRNRCGGWLGYDGRNGLFRIVVNNKMGDASNAWSYGNTITFSKSDGVDAPTTAHEYTHSVMGEVSGQLLDLPETGSLKEAYADVMAAVIMEPDTWDLGGRNLANPAESTSDEDGERDGNSQHPSIYEGRYWWGLGDEQPASTNDYGGKHQNSTVISHAAYLMHEKGLSADLIGRIWFRSMGYLDLRSDFYTCRYAVLTAARSLGCGSEAEEIIKAAFDEVGIMRFDVSAMRVRPNAKVYVEDANGERIQEFGVQLRYAGSEFGRFRGEVACSASTDSGCVDMASDFGGEPLIGHYFFNVSSKDAAQAYGPVISVEMDGVEVLVITLPILVVHQDGATSAADDVLPRKLITSFRMTYIDKDYPEEESDGWVRASYDEQGRMTHKEIDGVCDWFLEGPSFSLDYKYDDSGRLDEVSGVERNEYEVRWDVAYGDDGLTSRASGVVSGSEYFALPYHVDDVFDESGNLITRDYLIYEGQPHSYGSLAFTYDSSGRLVSQSADIGYVGVDSEWYDKERYEIGLAYDGEGNLASIETLDASGKLLSKYEFEYDSNRMTGRNRYVYDEYGDTVRDTYTYDADGHLASCHRVTSWRGEASSSTEATATFETDSDGSIVSARIESEDYVITYDVEYATVSTPRGNEPHNAIDLTDPLDPVYTNELWVEYPCVDITPFGASEMLRVNREWLETYD